MPKTKIAVTVDSSLLDELDGLVATGRFASRSQALEGALAEKLDRLRRGRLARESALLDAGEEKRFAEEGMSAVMDEWPEY